jgi:DNA (cytosine-5)-methyltransferase 1
LSRTQLQWLTGQNTTSSGARQAFLDRVRRGSSDQVGAYVAEWVRRADTRLKEIRGRLAELNQDNSEEGKSERTKLSYEASRIQSVSEGFVDLIAAREQISGEEFRQAVEGLSVSLEGIDPTGSADATQDSRATEQYESGIPDQEGPTSADLRRLARQGDSDAALELARRHETGDRAEPHEAKARYWFNVALSQAGDTDAMVYLGMVYEGRIQAESPGAPRSINKARDLYRRAFEMGNDEAGRLLGELEQRLAGPAPRARADAATSRSGPSAGVQTPQAPRTPRTPREAPAVQSVPEAAQETGSPQAAPEAPSQPRTPKGFSASKKPPSEVRNEDIYEEMQEDMSRREQARQEQQAQQEAEARAAEQRRLDEELTAEEQRLNEEVAKGAKRDDLRVRIVGRDTDTPLQKKVRAAAKKLGRKVEFIRITQEESRPGQRRRRSPSGIRGFVSRNSDTIYIVAVTENQASRLEQDVLKDHYLQTLLHEVAHGFVQDKTIREQVEQLLTKELADSFRSRFMLGDTAEEIEEELAVYTLTQDIVGSRGVESLIMGSGSFKAFRKVADSLVGLVEAILPKNQRAQLLKRVLKDRVTVTKKAKEVSKDNPAREVMGQARAATPKPQAEPKIAARQETKPTPTREATTREPAARPKATPPQESRPNQDGPPVARARLKTEEGFVPDKFRPELQKGFKKQSSIVDVGIPGHRLILYPETSKAERDRITKEFSKPYSRRRGPSGIPSASPRVAASLRGIKPASGPAFIKLTKRLANPLRDHVRVQGGKMIVLEGQDSPTNVLGVTATRVGHEFSSQSFGKISDGVYRIEGGKLVDPTAREESIPGSQIFNEVAGTRLSMDIDADALLADIGKVLAIMGSSATTDLSSIALSVNPDRSIGMAALVTNEKGDIVGVSETNIQEGSKAVGAVFGQSLLDTARLHTAAGATKFTLRMNNQVLELSSIGSGSTIGRSHLMLMKSDTRSIEDRLRSEGVRFMREISTAFSGIGSWEMALRDLVSPGMAVESDLDTAAAYAIINDGRITVDDVRNVPTDFAKDSEIFCASPVCKSYSQANRQGGEQDLDIATAKWTASVIRDSKPPIVMIENVPEYATRSKGAYTAITKALEDGGYTWDAKVYKASDFGAATTRSRLIIRAVRDGELPPSPKATHGIQGTPVVGWMQAAGDLVSSLPESKMPQDSILSRRLEEEGGLGSEPLLLMGSPPSQSSQRQGIRVSRRGDEPAFTIKATSKEVIRVWDGKTMRRATPRFLARLHGIPDSVPLPQKQSLAKTVIGNGIPLPMVRAVAAPLLETSSQTQGTLFMRDRLASMDAPYMAAIERGDMAEAKRLVDEAIEVATQFRGVHRAPDGRYGEPSIDAMDKMYPDDIYSPDGARLYGHGDKLDRKAHAIIMGSRGKPGKTVKVYRSVPKGRSLAILPGEWVTPVREYAAQHGDRFESGYEIVAASARAGDLYTEGNSIYEFGWSPQIETVLKVDGRTIPLSERFDPGREGLRFMRERSDSQLVADHAAAFERGDVEAAKRLVDIAAKQAGYTNGPLFHGSKMPTIRIFKPGVEDNGIYFSSSRAVAKTYSGASKKSKIYEGYLRIDNPLEIDAEGGSWGNLANSKVLREGKATGWTVQQLFGFPNSYTDKLSAAVRKSGFDGIVIRNVHDSASARTNIPSDVFIALSPNQIKSADPFTYDDQGQLVPLDKRFDDSTGDIRFMRERFNKASIRRLLDSISALDESGAIRTAMFWEMSNLERAIQRYREELGELADDLNPAELYQLAGGKRIDMVERFDREEIRPFEEKVADLAKRSGMSELEVRDLIQEYAYVVHARDANTELQQRSETERRARAQAKRNGVTEVLEGDELEAMLEQMSKLGISNEEAIERQKQLDAEFDRIGGDWAGAVEMLRSMNRRTLEMRRDAGLITQASYDTLIKRYPSYVPIVRSVFGEEGEVDAGTSRPKKREMRSLRGGNEATGRTFWAASYAITKHDRLVTAHRIAMNEGHMAFWELAMQGALKMQDGTSLADAVFVDQIVQDAVRRARATGSTRTGEDGKPVKASEFDQGVEVGKAITEATADIDSRMMRGENESPDTVRFKLTRDVDLTDPQVLRDIEDVTSSKDGLTSEERAEGMKPRTQKQREKKLEQLERQKLVYKKGSAMHFRINDPILANAMLNRTPTMMQRAQEKGGLVGKMSNAWMALMNYQRFAYVTASPGFIVGEMFRSPQQVAIMARVLADKYRLPREQAEQLFRNLELEYAKMFFTVPVVGAARSAPFVSSSWKSAKHILRGGKPRDEYEELIAEAIEAGVLQGGIFNVDSYEQMSAKLRREIADLADGTTKSHRKHGRLSKAGQFAGWVEMVTTALDMSNRMQLYRAAREAGLSKQKAAVMARESTIDFGKKGSFNRGANELYLFFNPRMQGIHQLLRAFKQTSRGRLSTTAAVLGRYFLYAFLLKMVVEMFFEDDENPDTWLGKFASMQNTIIPIPGTESENGQYMYFEINNPYGFGAIAKLAYRFGDVLMGDSRPGDLIVGGVGDVMSELTPIQFDGMQLLKGKREGLESFLAAVMPTNVQPLVSAFMNRDWKGAPIAPLGPEFGAGENRESLDYWPDTMRTSIWASQGIAELTGVIMRALQGPQARGVEISPNKLGYIFERYLPGVATQFRDLIKTVGQMSDGTRRGIGSVPVVNLVIGQSGGRSVMPGRFRDDLATIAANLDQDIKADGLAPTLKRYGNLSWLAGPEFSAAKRQLKKLQEARNNATERGDRVRATKLEDRMNEIRKRMLIRAAKMRNR